MNTIQDTKDVIRNRMLRYASRLWGYPGAVSEDSFDPVLGMLVGACAAEIEKIGKESGLSHARLVEAIAQLIVPEADTRALPAHGIAHIPSSDLEDTIDINTNLSCEKEFEHELNKQSNIKNFTFVPSVKTQIHQAQIKYILPQNIIYKQSEGRYKEIFASAKYGKRFNESAIFLGIENKGQQTEMSDVRIFFDLEEGDSNQALFFSNLQYAHFSLNGKPLEVYAGFQSLADDKGIIEQALNNHSLINKKQRDINSFYAPNFISIKNLPNLSKCYAPYPEELDGFFDDEDLDAMESNIFWVKIVFPSMITVDSLSNLSCHLNCFPVVNIKRNKESFHLQDELNIRPLVCDDLFYDLESVIDSNGISYDKGDILLNKKSDKAQASPKQYVIRSSGVGRLDGRQAEDMLRDLLDVLSEERLAFSVFGTDSLQGDVAALDRQIKLLRNKIQKVNNSDTGVHYLMLTHDKSSETTYLYITYWETGGELGNGIKKGNSLKIGGDSLLAGKNAVLMTRTLGGRNKLNGEEKVQAFKSTYLTKNRIVTMSDVKETVKTLLGKKAKHVELRKGVSISPNRNEGFVRVIEVDLELNSDYLFFNNEQDAIAFQNLIAKQLEDASAAMHLFKVSIK